MVRLFVVVVDNLEGDTTLAAANKLHKKFFLGAEEKFAFKKDKAGNKHAVMVKRMTHGRNRRFGRFFMSEGYSYRSVSIRNEDEETAIANLLDPPEPVVEEILPEEEVISGGEGTSVPDPGDEE